VKILSYGVSWKKILLNMKIGNSLTDWKNIQCIPNVDKYYIL
jgi:hypothetical protein